MATKVEIYEGAVDKGLEGVVACTTGISSIVDATLCFRGYTIEDLAANSTFEEVIYLLWYDKRPTTEELKDFKKELGKEMFIDPELVKQLQAMPTKDVHPMAWLRTAVSMLALWDKEAQGIDKAAQKKIGMRLTAKLGLLVALFERTRKGLSFVPANSEKTIAWNFINMLFGKEPDAEIVRMFDVCLILHADHELNCSAFSARVTASSLSDMYSAVTSAIGTLKGPLHGGANEQVMLMLKSIGTMENAVQWIKDALDNKVKVMGFGHRVYKNGDPRAKILRKMSEQITKKINEPKWYQMSALIDDTVQKEKGLLPNVDFYSATVYHSMNIPIDLFTPIFAVSRVSGWLAHIFEQYANNRIYRPRGQWIGKEGLRF
ncbi:MAG: citrate synthase [Bdellovibrionales bacterium RBG_16_40_8]|nr:MAG: citrate synthase [Bdellovibrionales bacterium RBG_16_40_8]